MRKTARTISLFIALIIAISVFSGCEAAEKTFSKDGLSITMTDDFIEQENDELSAFYFNSKYAVSILKEDFSLFDTVGISTDISETEYAKIVIDTNEISGTVSETDGLVTFSFEREVEEIPFSYFAVAKKGTNAFWIIYFACKTEIYKETQPLFLTWAKSITVE